MNSLLALCAATAILVAIPGPNVTLIVANSLRYGVHAGVVTVFGTTLGVALQVGLVVLGMAAVIALAAEALGWIRWAGVAWLVYLGARAWREPAAEPDRTDAQAAVFWRACIIAAMNPKTLLFNAAFLPQFVPPQGGACDALLVAGLFLALLLLGDLLWALFASSARRALGLSRRIRNRLTGGFLVATGIGLALSRREI